MREVPLIDRAIAHACREAYRTAASMTTAELCACEPAYRAATGIGPDVPVTGAALTQLRMVNTLIDQRSFPWQVRRAFNRQRANARSAR